MDTAREAPQQIKDMLHSWWKAFWFWNGVHYILGLTATIGTVLIANNAGGHISKNVAAHVAKNVAAHVAKNVAAHSNWFFAYLPVYVAVATAAITFMKSGTKANAYISAWRKLNAERIAFELDTNYPEAKLAQELKKCEVIIGKAD